MVRLCRFNERRQLHSYPRIITCPQTLSQTLSIRSQPHYCAAGHAGVISGMKRKLLLCLNAFSLASTLAAQTTNRMSLEDLRTVQLPEVVVDSIKQVGSDKEKGFVEVKGVIGEHIRFELLLPD